MQFFKKNYIFEIDSILNVLFLVFYYLDNDEEIKFFNVINIRVKENGMSYFLYKVIGLF